MALICRVQSPNIPSVSNSSGFKIKKIECLVAKKAVCQSDYRFILSVKIVTIWFVLPGSMVYKSFWIIEAHKSG